MIERLKLLAFDFYKYRPFTGSYKNMCYKITKTEIVTGTKKETDADGNETEVEIKEPRFIVYAWKGPLAYDYTDKAAMITSELYPFEKGSLNVITDWLNEQAKTLA